MFISHRRIALLYRLNNAISEPIQTLKCHPFLHKFSSTTTTSDSDKNSFTISYLTNNCGFSPEAALKASKLVRFDTAKKPNSAIAFFTNHGFSISQTHKLILRAPDLLVCNPATRVLPKFQFLASKGASASDIVAAVIKNPRFLLYSLDNYIIPAFQFVRRFCPSDEKAISCVVFCSVSLSDDRVKSNVKLLLDSGVAPSNIGYLFHTTHFILSSDDLWKTVEEVKGLGFDPSKTHFVLALHAKRLSKSQRDAKVEAFKKWGWSDDAIALAFRKDPHIMLRSSSKINAVVSLWVDQLGWDPSVLVAAPILFGFSLEKRLTPRASVLRYLLSRGLMKKGASLVKPFMLSEELFLQKFVVCFEEEETSKLLSLYHGGC